MAISNIYNFYVSMPPKGKQMPRVFQSPVTMPAEEAKKALQEELSKRNKTDILPAGELLHVCFDSESKRIYIPNASHFTRQKLAYLLQAAQLRITKLFGGYVGRQPIEGSPFSLLRIRNIENFAHASSTIKEKFHVNKIDNVPVIEANFDRMPKTIKQLPAIFQTNGFPGSYVSPEFVNTLYFVEEYDLNGNKLQKPILVYQQNTPFILINSSPQARVESSEKERIVMAGYRLYLFDAKAQGVEMTEEEAAKVKTTTTALSILYDIKQRLYIGFPFEEICEVFIREFAGNKGFGELMQVSRLLLMAAKNLELEGYKNPAIPPYYIACELKEGSPLLAGRNPFFQVVQGSQDGNKVIIETPLYIPPDLCSKLLVTEPNPVIARYNKAVNAIDIKSGQFGFQQQLRNDKMQIAKLRALTIYDAVQDNPDLEVVKSDINFRTDVHAVGVSLSSPHMHSIRRISDYYYACDHIMKMCEKRGIEFVDLPVLVGPIEYILGPGIGGGFMPASNWVDQSGKPLPNPLEIEKGLFISPPAIAINSIMMPSYAQQTATLIHEYSHNIFEIQNPGYVARYQDPQVAKLRESDPYRFWRIYLGDKNEQVAHIEEIKYRLNAGETVDEIIRDRVGGAVTLKNYPEALAFKQLIVDKAITELKQEKSDADPS